MNISSSEELRTHMPPGTPKGVYLSGSKFTGMIITFKGLQIPLPNGYHRQAVPQGFRAEVPYQVLSLYPEVTSEIQSINDVNNGRGDWARITGASYYITDDTEAKKQSYIRTIGKSQTDDKGIPTGLIATMDNGGEGILENIPRPGGEPWVPETVPLYDTGAVVNIIPGPHQESEIRDTEARVFSTGAYGNGSTLTYLVRGVATSEDPQFYPNFSLADIGSRGNISAISTDPRFNNTTFSIKTPPQEGVSWIPVDENGEPMESVPQRGGRRRKARKTKKSKKSRKTKKSKKSRK